MAYRFYKIVWRNIIVDAYCSVEKVSNNQNALLRDEICGSLFFVYGFLNFITIALSAFNILDFDLDSYATLLRKRYAARLKNWIW